MVSGTGRSLVGVLPPLHGSGPEEDETDSDKPSKMMPWRRCFRQHLLAWWQPVLVPRWVLLGYAVAVLLLWSIGAVLLVSSRSVEEYVVEYTDLPTDANGVVEVEIRVKRRMEPPIWMLYELEGFHQNHRRYIQSRSHEQLKDSGEVPKFREQELHDDCEPRVSSDGLRVDYPCGLVAHTIFNDSYVVLTKSDSSDRWERLGLDSRARTIAWAADVEAGRYSNLNPEAVARGQSQPNGVLLNMWILRQFPPVTCEQVDFSDGTPFVPVEVATRNETLAGGALLEEESRQVEVADCTGYMTSSPSCNFARAGQAFSCSGGAHQQVHHEEWGIESGHFMVWMRVAGLPRFRKLWGRIDTPLEKDAVIRVVIVSRFPVKPFHGKKAVVISSSSPLGGRNPALGSGYLIVGGFCMLFALAFSWRQATQPRPLGDVRRLQGIEKPD